MKPLRTLWLAVLLLGSTVAYAQEPQCTNAARTAVRETPGGRIIGHIPARHRLTFFERDGRWAMVSWQGRPNIRNPYFGRRTGWIDAAVLRC